MMQLLLDNGADVSPQSASAGKALTAAAERGQFEAVRLLLEKRVNADARAEKEDLTALMQAAGTQA
jgi:ankyrin repeat protein